MILDAHPLLFLPPSIQGVRVQSQLFCYEYTNFKRYYTSCKEKNEKIYKYVVFCAIWYMKFSMTKSIFLKEDNILYFLNVSLHWSNEWAWRSENIC